jgi:hypothetical protein
MSDTAKALLFKFLMTFIIGWIAFGFLDNNPFSWILTFAVVGTIVNYLAGDLLVLPGLGTIVGAIGDGAMAVLLAYILDILSFNFDTTITSLVVLGILVAVGEYFFHQYLLNNDKVAP